MKSVLLDCTIYIVYKHNSNKKWMFLNMLYKKSYFRPREVLFQCLFSLSITIFYICVNVLCKKLKMKVNIEFKRELHGATTLVNVIFIQKIKHTFS